MYMLHKQLINYNFTNKIIAITIFFGNSLYSHVHCKNVRQYFLKMNKGTYLHGRRSSHTRKKRDQRESRVENEVKGIRRKCPFMQSGQFFASKLLRDARFFTSDKSVSTRKYLHRYTYSTVHTWWNTFANSNR